MASREEIISHMDMPICKILSGLRIHLEVIGLTKKWELCYILHCDSPEALVSVMWDMIKKRRRKDPKWQKNLPNM